MGIHWVVVGGLRSSVASPTIGPTVNSTVLDDLARVIGYTPTRYLLAWYGGRQLYVPKHCKVTHPLRRLVGLVAYRALVAEFGDSRLAIPADREDRRYRRDRLITERIADGASDEGIAHEFGIGLSRAAQIRRAVTDRGWLEYADGPPARGRWRGHPPPRLTLSRGPESAENFGTGEGFPETPGGFGRGR